VSRAGCSSPRQYSRDYSQWPEKAATRCGAAPARSTCCSAAAASSQPSRRTSLPSSAPEAVNNTSISDFWRAVASRTKWRTSVLLAFPEVREGGNLLEAASSSRLAKLLQRLTRMAASAIPERANAVAGDDTPYVCRERASRCPTIARQPRPMRWRSRRSSRARSTRSFAPWPSARAQHLPASSGAGRSRTNRSSDAGELRPQPRRNAKLWANSSRSCTRRSSIFLKEGPSDPS
jgi:hypothetical protein